LDTLEPRSEDPLWIAWSFLIHVVVGSLIFSLIAIVGLSLRYLVELLTYLGLPKELEQAFTALEYIVLIADCGLFVIFLFRVFLERGRKLWGSMKIVEK
jgi:hypothetical protein